MSAKSQAEVPTEIQQDTNSKTEKGSAGINQQSAPQKSGKIIKVKTDFLEAEINTLGGDISYLALLKQPDTLDKSKPLVLFDRGKGTHNYFAQSGLIGPGLPNHNSLFDSDQTQYELSGNEEQLQVRLKAVG